MNTMQLLEKALKQQPAPYWTAKLKLSRNTLSTAKVRGHLSPAIAGALAEELGEDAAAWMVIAALEGERESACKSRMIKKFVAGSALALGTTAALAANSSGSLYIMSSDSKSRRCSKRQALAQKKRPARLRVFLLEFEKCTTRRAICPSF